MTDTGPGIDALFRRYADRIYRYARIRLSPADAEDVVSETFVVALRRQADIPSDPEPWLLAVARRTMANQLRSSKRRRALWDRVATRPQVFFPDHADAVGEVEVARRVLARLSDADREVLALLATGDLSAAQLGAVLGCSANAATVRTHRARKRLAAAFDAEDHAHAQPMAQPSARPPRPSADVLPQSREQS